MTHPHNSAKQHQMHEHLGLTYAQEWSSGCKKTWLLCQRQVHMKVVVPIITAQFTHETN